MNMNADRDDPAFNNWEEPSLADMTEKAIRVLSKHEEGYFLMVEGNTAELTSVSLLRLCMQVGKGE